MEPNPVPFLAALADPTRLRLLLLLAGRPANCALCVMALARRLGVSQPAVSQHLRVLKALGLVQAQRCGTRVHYRLDQARLQECWHSLEAILGPAMGQMPAPPQDEGS